MRDQRPLGYSGRVVGPLPSSLEENQEWLWKTSSLVQLRRTIGEAKQLKSNAMIAQEQIGPSVLPPSDSGKSSTIHGAQKYAQLGCDAAEQILHSAVVLQIGVYYCFLYVFVFVQNSNLEVEILLRYYFPTLLVIECFLGRSQLDKQYGLGHC